MQSRGLDGLVPLREFESIDKDMTPQEGVRILCRRLGTTPARVRREVRDRHPSGHPKEERRSLDRCHPKCFLRFDIMFTDVLHTCYWEMKHLGLGRRYLVNKILRAVLAGMCDAEDPTGAAGDFSPRSWTGDLRAGATKEVQLKCLDALKRGEAKLLQSVKVRLRKASTQVLLELEQRCPAIRSMSRKAYASGASGLRWLSDMLTEYRRRFYRETRFDDFRNRMRRVKKKASTSGRSKTFRIAVLRKAHMSFSVFLRGMNDLRKLLDPSVPSWYRRPTDDDWKEGLRGSRIPVGISRGTTFRKYGLGPVPGIDGPLPAEEWARTRTDWSLSEARALFRANTGSRLQLS